MGVTKVRCTRLSIAVLGWLVSLGSCLGSAFAAEQVGGERRADQHDMVLLLPDGPVHLRVHISDHGKPLEQTRRDYLANLVIALDMDEDGRVSRLETAKHPLFAATSRFQSNSFLKSLRSQQPYRERELELAVDKAAGQLVTYRQNNALAEQDLSVFGVLDQDQSGLIERDEMRLAAARIAERDSDFDQCVTFDEFLNDNVSAPVDIIINAGDDPPGSVHAELLRDAAEPVLPARLVRRYDTDRDAHLTAAELGWQESRAAALDQDRDRRLSMQELTSFALAAPDLTLSVDFSQPPGKAFHVMGDQAGQGESADDEVVRLERTGVLLEIGYRHRDPIAEAKENAAVTFNAIDVDANGYLDREEIADHQRFERYLFDGMDRDGDERVFADEMTAYVTDYTEPASTTCQVTLLDTGNGFFQRLDQNGDGRISIRELRGCEDVLVNTSDSQPAINPSKLAKSYRIEIQRGGVSLFGRVDRPTAESPIAILKPLRGPVWFQRMDRNGDGDLTWDEFLGPREIFHRLDQDQDDLLDEHEASHAYEASHDSDDTL